MAATRKLKQEIYIAEIYLDRLFQLPLRVPRYQPLSRFPAVDRDFSFVFNDEVTFEQIHSAVLGLSIAELQGFKPVEIFRGGSVPAGKYSLLLRVQFQSSPIAAIETWRSPVLLIHGDDDRTVDFRQTIDLRARLVAKGVRVEELVLPDEVHDSLLWRSWKAAAAAAAEFFESALSMTPR